ncbi:hypothetical protein D9M70_616290 [compost metagenome]
MTSEATLGPEPLAHCSMSSSVARMGRRRSEMIRCAAAKMRTDTMSSGTAPGFRLMPRRNSNNSSLGSTTMRGLVLSSRRRSQANSDSPLFSRSQRRARG